MPNKNNCTYMYLLQASIYWSKRQCRTAAFSMGCSLLQFPRSCNVRTVWKSIWCSVPSSLCVLSFTGRPVLNLLQIGSDSHSLPSPELYIILNSNPTKQKPQGSVCNLIDACAQRHRLYVSIQLECMVHTYGLWWSSFVLISIPYI